MPFPLSSNQQCRLSAVVIIMTAPRQASDDWWEPHPNQWQMPDKCLLWRLWQRHLRWSAFSNHYTIHEYLSCTLDPLFNQGLSGTWHSFQECYSTRFLIAAQPGKHILISPTMIEVFLHVKGFWMPELQHSPSLCHHRCSWVPDRN